MNDERVTPENCPEGSFVKIEVEIEDECFLLYNGIIHWQDKKRNKFTLDYTGNAHSGN